MSTVNYWTGQIVVKEKVKNYVGKVVYVLDDFVTTGQTLQKSCKALTSLEIHTHGVAFMLWSYNTAINYEKNNHTDANSIQVNRASR